MNPQRSQCTLEACHPPSCARPTRPPNPTNDPFRATYRTSGGDRVAPQPAGRSIWAASASGTGARGLTWEVEDGSWSAVVMNADGSPVVDADVSAGASAPFLDDLGWIVLGGGIVLVLAAGGLLVVAIRTRR